MRNPFFVQANCIDSTMPAEAVFAAEVEKLKADQFKPSEQVTLEPFERDYACVVGGYRMPKKQKATSLKKRRNGCLMLALLDDDTHAVSLMR